MSPSSYTRIVLAERPITDIVPTTFRKEILPFDLRPSNGQVLVKVTWLSLDPAMRGWLRNARSYLPPVQIGEVMRATGLGTVIQVGGGSTYSVGDTVMGDFGWTEYIVVKSTKVQKIIPPNGAEAIDFLHNLGFPGMTAYFGLKDVGKIKPGETLVVSGAAGAVGSLVCQLGKKIGAKVIGIAGTSEKCEWLDKELGVDKALNYKAPDFIQQFKSIGYLDVFFDNVGGSILDLAMTRLNKYARVVLCGAISDYNAQRPHGLSAYLNLISQRAKIEGFVVFDYAPHFEEARQEIAEWLADGSLRRKFHIVDGLDNAPSALPLLFSGGNTGKLVVNVSDVVSAKL